MERNLCGGSDLQSSVNVFLSKSSERLHHGLVYRLGVIYLFHHIVAVGKHLIHIALSPALRAQITLRTVFPASLCHIVIFRMYDNVMIQRLCKVKNRLQHLIFYLDDPQRPVDAPPHLFLPQWPPDRQHNGLSDPESDDRRDSVPERSVRPR